MISFSEKRHFFLLQKLCADHFLKSIFSFQSFSSGCNSLWLLIFSYFTQFFIFSSSFFLWQYLWIYWLILIYKFIIYKYTNWCYFVLHLFFQIQNQIHLTVLNPFHVIGLFLYPLVVWCSQGVYKEISGIIWVNYLFTINKEKTRVMIYICSKSAVIAKFERIQQNNILFLFWSFNMLYLQGLLLYRNIHTTHL